MDSEVCRLRILSEEYRDFIMPVGGGRVRLNLSREQLCRRRE